MITMPQGTKPGLNGFLKVNAMRLVAIDSTQIMERSTTLKSTSRKKTMIKKVDMPNSVMKVTNRRESKFAGCTNRLSASSCSSGNFQMKEYRETNCKFAGL